MGTMATAGGAASIVPAEMSCCRPVPIDCDGRRRKIDAAGIESKFEEREFSVQFSYSPGHINTAQSTRALEPSAIYACQPNPIIIRI